MTTTKEPASTATGKLSLAEVLAVFTRGATRIIDGSPPTTAAPPEPTTPNWDWTCGLLAVPPIWPPRPVNSVWPAHTCR